MEKEKLWAIAKRLFSIMFVIFVIHILILEFAINFICNYAMIEFSMENLPGAKLFGIVGVIIVSVIYIILTFINIKAIISMVKIWKNELISELNKICIILSALQIIFMYLINTGIINLILTKI